MKKIIQRIPYHLKLVISVIYTGIVLLLSLLPSKDLPKVPLFPGADKLIHIAMYFILSLLYTWTFQSRKLSPWKLYGFMVFWGLLMEILQVSMKAGRHFSVFDLLANITGIILGIILYKAIAPKFHLS